MGPHGPFLKGGEEMRHSRITKEHQEIVITRLNKIAHLAHQITINTPLACWYEMHGHVAIASITVCTDKENYNDKIHNAELSCMPYYFDFLSDEETQKNHEEFIKKFKSNADTIIKDLKTILSDNWTKRYKVYVNCIDMGCSKDFISLKEAKKYEKSMRRKYKKVGAMIGIKEETVRQ